MKKECGHLKQPLPPGWTIERIRAVSGDKRASVLTGERLVVLEEWASPEYLPMHPELILNFGGLCLVLSDGEWHMGGLDETDGSIICWESCGDDLHHALRSL